MSEYRRLLRSLLKKTKKFLGLKIYYYYKLKFSFKKKKLNIGRNTYVSKSAQIIGRANVKIGKNSMLSDFSWINVNYRNDGISLIIGNNCFIGERNFFTVGEKITIGDFFISGVDCCFLGAGHKYSNPMVPYLLAEVEINKTITIEDNVWIGAQVVVIGNVNIGRGSIIGAGSLVNMDIPPFSIAFGRPAKLVKRYNFNNLKWVNIEEWDEEFEKYFPHKGDYINYLLENYKDIIIPLQAGTRYFGGI